jgi:UPF0755 protein
VSRPLKHFFFAALLAGFAIVSVTTSILFWRALDSPMSITDSGEWLNVPLGTPLARVADGLNERGILQTPKVLSIYGRISGEATRIHAGEYLIPSASTPIQLLEQLVSGQVYLHQITVVDGWRFQEFVAALQNHEAVDSAGLDAEVVMDTLGSSGTHPEGQFFPDTYWFPRDTPAIDILQQSHEALEEQLALAWSGYRTGTVLQRPYDALILASIIEKETALANERRRIAGVFHRRLEQGVRLQTDPTVIYGLGSNFDGNLRRSDLVRDTPYNTYTRMGLPPTPISLPGRAALRAAVDPEAGPELYFVATGEGDGSHYFSSTLEEHNAAVARYLQEIRSSR